MPPIACVIVLTSDLSRIGSLAQLVASVVATQPRSATETTREGRPHRVEKVQLVGAELRMPVWEQGPRHVASSCKYSKVQQSHHGCVRGSRARPGRAQDRKAVAPATSLREGLDETLTVVGFGLSPAPRARCRRQAQSRIRFRWGSLKWTPVKRLVAGGLDEGIFTGVADGEFWGPAGTSPWRPRSVILVRGVLSDARGAPWRVKPSSATHSGRSSSIARNAVRLARSPCASSTWSLFCTASTGTVSPARPSSASAPGRAGRVAQRSWNTASTRCPSGSRTEAP